MVTDRSPVKPAMMEIFRMTMDATTNAHRMRYGRVDANRPAMMKRIDTDACTNVQEAVCGDGIVRRDVEECDGGLGCSDECELIGCGNGDDCRILTSSTSPAVRS